MSSKPTLDEALEQVSVHEINYNNDLGNHSVNHWFGVSTDELGIVAYFGREEDALRYRLDLINQRVNGSFNQTEG